MSQGPAAGQVPPDWQKRLDALTERLLGLESQIQGFGQDLWQSAAGDPGAERAEGGPPGSPGGVAPTAEDAPRHRVSRAADDGVTTYCTAARGAEPSRRSGRVRSPATASADRAAGSPDPSKGPRRALDRAEYAGHDARRAGRHAGPAGATATST